jgi:hypothetical protein
MQGLIDKSKDYSYLSPRLARYGYGSTTVNVQSGVFHQFHQGGSVTTNFANQGFNSRKAAEDFCKATLDTSFGTDLQTVKKVFKEVYENNAHASFDAAVAERAKQDGYSVNNAVEVLDRKFNGILKPFMQVPRKECMDILLHGKNLYRSTPMEYRMRGMWTAISDFLTVCKKHPVMSSAVIGSVAYFGGTYPFLGAISGIMIMAWAGAVTLINELKARKLPGMDEKKAECYLQSGENIMAFLLTFSGVDGIYSGAKNGLSVFAKTAPDLKNMNAFNNILIRSWAAIASKLKHGEEVGLRFVVGLFDNVLLPFNALSERLQNK